MHVLQTRCSLYWANRMGEEWISNIACRHRLNIVLSGNCLAETRQSLVTAVNSYPRARCTIADVRSLYCPHFKSYITIILDLLLFKELKLGLVHAGLTPGVQWAWKDYWPLNGYWKEADKLLETSTKGHLNIYTRN
jgi:hypothetical protein